MKKAIFHAVDMQRISAFIECNHPGTMAKVELVKITQDLDDPSALILDFQYKRKQRDGMQYITAIMIFNPRKGWEPVALPMFERVTATSDCGF